MGEIGSIQIVWVIVLVICLGIEIATLGLATIWFAIGAFIAFLVSLTPASPAIQIATFFATSLLLLYFTRPIAVKFLKLGRVKTNYEEIIGKYGVVTEDIDNLKPAGQVQLNGQFWTARSAETQTLTKDTVVEVVAIQGVKLIVKEKREANKWEK
ncbi:MAG: NfeD family protein [Clostridiales bacterium]|jgi:membrane protein implicated in regulation of membrane protease activity|nr:NfeD family protein [Clostridiales bacterium]